jgi:hypothetical protein
MERARQDTNRLRGKWRATNLDCKNLDGSECRMERHPLSCGGRGAEPESGSDGSGSQADRPISRSETESVADAPPGATVSLAAKSSAGAGVIRKSLSNCNAAIATRMHSLQSSMTS